MGDQYWIYWLVHDELDDWGVWTIEYLRNKYLTYEIVLLTTFSDHSGTMQST
jgi:hypothetical protein